MSGFTKKSIDRYIRTRIKYWIYDLGRNAHLYLKDDLELSTNEKEQLTDLDKYKIKTFQIEVQNSTIVTGGCFTSMLQGDEPNDIDIYFNDKEVALKVCWFYIRKMLEVGELKETTHVHKIGAEKTEDGVHVTIRSQGVAGAEIQSEEYRYFEQYPNDYVDHFFKEYRKKIRKAQLEDKKSYHVSFITSNAITLNNGLQIITRFVGEPDVIHSYFDYIHATNYWTWEQGVVYNDRALQATLEKRLYYFGSKFPVASIFRLKKFIERGWRISAGEMVKILYDVSKLDLDSVEVLRDQSMGMDSAYFNQVIHMLRDREGELDRTYLFQCLETVFNMADKQDDFLDSKSDEEDDDDDHDQPATVTLSDETPY